MRQFSKSTYFPLSRELKDYLGIDGDGNGAAVLVECVEIDGRPSLILKRQDGEATPDAIKL